MQTKRRLPHWPRILIVAALVLVTLACSIIETYTPTAQPTPAPTWTPIPTWTPVPTATPTPKPTTGEISGQVIDASSSSPVPNANVYTDPPTVSVTADTQGRYVIPEVLPGVYTITATKSGYTSASVSIAVTAGTTTTADVHLMASQVSTELSSAIAIWQVGVRDQSDTEFGGSLGRAPLFYQVPPEWISMVKCTDCWKEFPSQLNPPEDWPDMPQTVHMRYNYPASINSLILRVVVNGRDVLQGERLRILFDEILIDDVVVTTVLPAWDTFEFNLPAISPNEHVVTLENSGGGGLAFDYIQALTTDSDYSAPVPNPTTELPLTEGLVAYYPFNGNADDESGNGNHGIAHGATLASDRSGASNGAYGFDGVDDYIEIADSNSLDIEEQITIAAWVLFHSNPGGGSRIVEKPYMHCGYPWVMYTLRMCCGANRFAFDVTTSGSNHVLDSAHGQPAEEWHHIVGTYDGETQRIYVDGVLDGLSGHTGMLDTNNQPVTIGGSSVCIGHPRFEQQFHGLIDDVRIYNRVLSEAEVRALYEKDS